MSDDIGATHAYGAYDLEAIAKRFPASPETMLKDITFVNPADGTPETFIETRNLY